MQEPSVRNIAVLPVVAVATGAVIVLSTMIGQGASAEEECPPGTHAMSMGGTDMGAESGGDSMGGMDHSAHLGTGSTGSGCMPGMADSMNTDAPAADPADMPAMDDSTMTGTDHKRKAAKAKKTAKSKAHSTHTR